MKKIKKLPQLNLPLYKRGGGIVNPYRYDFGGMIDINADLLNKSLESSEKSSQSPSGPMPLPTPSGITGYTGATGNTGNKKSKFDLTALAPLGSMVGSSIYTAANRPNDYSDTTGSAIGMGLQGASMGSVLGPFGALAGGALGAGAGWLSAKNRNVKREDYENSVFDNYLTNSTQQPTTMMKDGGGIHINPEHEGEFTAYAKSKGMGVQEAANWVMSHSNDPHLRKQANFAINAAGWHHPSKMQDGGFNKPYTKNDAIRDSAILYKNNEFYNNYLDNQVRLWGRRDFTPDEHNQIKNNFSLFYPRISNNLDQAYFNLEDYNYHSPEYTTGYNPNDYYLTENNTNPPSSTRWYKGHFTPPYSKIKPSKPDKGDTKNGNIEPIKITQGSNIVRDVDIINGTSQNKKSPMKVSYVINGKTVYETDTEHMPKTWKEIPKKKYGGSIKIDEKNKGDFTAYSKSKGMGVQEAAHWVMAHSDDPHLRRQANFAINAAGWHHPSKMQDSGYPVVNMNYPDSTPQNLENQVLPTLQPTNPAQIEPSTNTGFKPFFTLNTALKSPGNIPGYREDMQPTAYSDGIKQKIKRKKTEDEKEEEKFRLWRDSIANVETEQYKKWNEKYSARGKENPNALGPWQFVWSQHKNEINKLFNIKTPEEFLNSPEIQEKYLRYYYFDHKTGPKQRLKLIRKLFKNLDLTDDEAMALVHNAGPTGSIKKIREGKYKNDPYLLKYRENKVKVNPSDYIDEEKWVPQIDPSLISSAKESVNSPDLTDELYKEKYNKTNIKKYGGGIHINPEHVGDFTAYAKNKGMGVQEAAHWVMTHSDDPHLRRQANFAINAAGWNHPIKMQISGYAYPPEGQGASLINNINEFSKNSVELPAVEITAPREKLYEKAYRLFNDAINYPQKKLVHGITGEFKKPSEHLYDIGALNPNVPWQSGVGTFEDLAMDPLNYLLGVYKNVSGPKTLIKELKIPSQILRAIQLNDNANDIRENIKNYNTTSNKEYDSGEYINKNYRKGNQYNKVTHMKEGGIPQRYRNMGFTHVGQKKDGDGKHKWKVLAKKGDKYKVVQGGYRGMEDYTQHHSEERRNRFWDRMGGKDSAKAKDPFSPLYWHKKLGTWQDGGVIFDNHKYAIGNYPYVMQEGGATEDQMGGQMQDQMQGQMNGQNEVSQMEGFGPGKPEPNEREPREKEVEAEDNLSYASQLALDGNNMVIPQMGGSVNPEKAVPIISVQTEKGENIVMPDGSIYDVKAEYKHEKMDRDEITDTLPEGAYVAGARSKQFIKKDDAEKVLLGNTPIVYSEFKNFERPEEVRFADIFKKGKHTPAELTKIIKNKFKTVNSEDDVLANITNEENKIGRIPYLMNVISMTESKKNKNKKSPAQKQAFQTGGIVNNTGYTPGYPSYNNPVNIIPSGDITMEKTPFEVLAMTDKGEMAVMKPGQRYNFKGKMVLEKPVHEFLYSDRPEDQQYKAAYFDVMDKTEWNPAPAAYSNMPKGYGAVLSPAEVNATRLNNQQTDPNAYGGNILAPAEITAKRPSYEFNPQEEAKRIAFENIVKTAFKLDNLGIKQTKKGDNLLNSFLKNDNKFNTWWRKLSPQDKNTWNRGGYDNIFSVDTGNVEYMRRGGYIHKMQDGGNPEPYDPSMPWKGQGEIIKNRFRYLPPSNDGVDVVPKPSQPYQPVEQDPGQYNPPYAPPPTGPNDIYVPPISPRNPSPVTPENPRRRPDAPPIIPGEYKKPPSIPPEDSAIPPDDRRSFIPPEDSAIPPDDRRSFIPREDSAIPPDDRRSFIPREDSAIPDDPRRSFSPDDETAVGLDYRENSASGQQQNKPQNNDLIGHLEGLYKNYGENLQALNDKYRGQYSDYFKYARAANLGANAIGAIGTAFQSSEIDPGLVNSRYADQMFQKVPNYVREAMKNEALAPSYATIRNQGNLALPTSTAMGRIAPMVNNAVESINRINKQFAYEDVNKDNAKAKFRQDIENMNLGKLANAENRRVGLDNYKLAQISGFGGRALTGDASILAKKIGTLYNMDKSALDTPLDMATKLLSLKMQQQYLDALKGTSSQNKPYIPPDMAGFSGDKNSPAGSPTEGGNKNDASRSRGIENKNNNDSKMPWTGQGIQIPWDGKGGSAGPTVVPWLPNRGDQYQEYPNPMEPKPEYPYVRPGVPSYSPNNPSQPPTGSTEAPGGSTGGFGFNSGLKFEIPTYRDQYGRIVVGEKPYNRDIYEWWKNNWNKPVTGPDTAPGFEPNLPPLPIKLPPNYK